MNKPKIKGSRFEREVADYLGTERLPLRGINDAGDVVWPGWVLELKCTREIDLAGALTEAARAATRNHLRRFAAVHKRRMKGVAESYVTLPLWLFKEITS